MATKKKTKERKQPQSKRKPEQITIPGPTAEELATVPPQLAPYLAPTGPRKRPAPPPTLPAAVKDDFDRIEPPSMNPDLGRPPTEPPSGPVYNPFEEVKPEELPPVDEFQTEEDKVEAKVRGEFMSKVLANVTSGMVGGLLQEICGTGRMLPPPPKWNVKDNIYWWRKVLIPAVMEKVTAEYVRQNEPWMKLLRGEDSYLNQPRWTALTLALFALFEILPPLLKEEVK